MVCAQQIVTTKCACRPEAVVTLTVSGSSSRQHADFVSGLLHLSLAHMVSCVILVVCDDSVGGYNVAVKVP